MNILLLSMGSRGDVEPFAILGSALKEKGHNVILCTARNYESLIQTYDIDFHPVEADFQQLAQSDEGKKMLGGKIFASGRFIRKTIYPLITHTLSEFYKLAEANDLIVYHIKTLADCFADQFHHKMLRASLIPVVEPTRMFPNPVLGGMSFPSFFYQATYALTWFMFRFFRQPISHFRKHVGLGGFAFMQYARKIKNIYAISEHFLPKPKDYSQESFFTGFWFSKHCDELPVELQHFLASGEPPVVVTFGSMPFGAEIAQDLINISEKHGIRFVVVKGWGSGVKMSHENIYTVEAVSYRALFPMAKAIIHHGGIGTTAECLRAGKPFWICPVMYPIGDQYFWGKLAFEKGLSPQPVPYRRLTEKHIYQSVRLILENPAYTQQAIALRDAMLTEDGIARAVEYIESMYNTQSS